MVLQQYNQSELKNLCEQEDSSCCASVLPQKRAVLVALSYKPNTALFDRIVWFFFLHECRIIVLWFKVQNTAIFLKKSAVLVPTGIHRTWAPSTTHCKASKCSDTEWRWRNRWGRTGGCRTSLHPILHGQTRVWSTRQVGWQCDVGACSCVTGLQGYQDIVVTWELNNTTICTTRTWKHSAIDNRLFLMQWTVNAAFILVIFCYSSSSINSTSHCELHHYIVSLRIFLWLL